MYAVCVQFDIHPEHLPAFMPLMCAQADNSLAGEEGCHHFDVCTDSNAPDKVFLYELYTDKAAFEAHLNTDHFKEFDSDVAPMVRAKTVTTYNTIHQPVPATG